MDIKHRPNHKLYIKILRKMTAEQRLKKAFELSEFSKKLFVEGLHKRFPKLSGDDFRKLLMKRLERCHNRNY